MADITAGEDENFEITITVKKKRLFEISRLEPTNSSLWDYLLVEFNQENSKKENRLWRREFGRLEILGDGILAVAVEELIQSRAVSDIERSKLKSNDLLAKIAKGEGLAVLFPNDVADSMEVLFAIIMEVYDFDGARRYIQDLLFKYSKKVKKKCKKRFQDIDVATYALDLILRRYVTNLYMKGTGGGASIRAHALRNGDSFKQIISMAFGSEPIVAKIYAERGFEEMQEKLLVVLPKSVNELKKYAEKFCPANKVKAF